MTAADRDRDPARRASDLVSGRLRDGDGAGVHRRGSAIRGRATSRWPWWEPRRSTCTTSRTRRRDLLVLAAWAALGALLLAVAARRPPPSGGREEMEIAEGAVGG
jgi:hypothetical protein